MAKRRMIDGQWHRLRRGKWVPIPPEWVGQVAHPQTQRKRGSHQTGGKKRRKNGGWSDMHHYTPSMSDARAPEAGEWT